MMSSRKKNLLLSEVINSNKYSVLSILLNAVGLSEYEAMSSSWFFLFTCEDAFLCVKCYKYFKFFSQLGGSMYNKTRGQKKSKGAT
jgi:hypothetical protein